MGAAMEEAKRLLYEKAIKKFTMQEITRHRTITNKSLVEMLSRYPGNGVGFKVYRKWWPENMFFHVKRVELFAPRYGRMWGIKYKDGKIDQHRIERVDDILKSRIQEKLRLETPQWYNYLLIVVSDVNTYNILKRGMWKYQLSDTAFTEQVVTLDNGLTMDLGKTQALIDQKKEFLEQRRKSMQWIGEPEPEHPKKVKKVAQKGKAPPKVAAAAKK